MKKTITFVFVALLFATLCASAQEMQLASSPRTESNHSASVGIVGVNYAYEFPLGRKVTVVGRIGLYTENFTLLANKKLNDMLIIVINPTIDIEPRFYYNLDRRARNGRNTTKNTASFAALQIKAVLPHVWSSDNHSESDGLILVSPLWGLRRVWNEHWLFEFAAGASLFQRDVDRWEWLPALNLRFGYSF